MATTEYEYIALAFKGGYRVTNAPKSPREFTESKDFFCSPAETETGGGVCVPRMSEKRKQEWALFLNGRNRITYNELCRKCQKDCKQHFRVAVIECPNYEI